MLFREGKEEKPFVDCTRYSVYTKGQIKGVLIHLTLTTCFRKNQKTHGVLLAPRQLPVTYSVLQLREQL